MEWGKAPVGPESLPCYTFGDGTGNPARSRDEIGPTRLARGAQSAYEVIESGGDVLIAINHSFPITPRCSPVYLHRRMS